MRVKNFPRHNQEVSLFLSSLALTTLKSPTVYYSSASFLLQPRKVLVRKHVKDCFQISSRDIDWED